MNLSSYNFFFIDIEDGEVNACSIFNYSNYCQVLFVSLCNKKTGILYAISNLEKIFED